MLCRNTIFYLLSEKRNMVNCKWNRTYRKGHSRHGIIEITTTKKPWRSVMTQEQLDTNLKRHRKYSWDAWQRVYEEHRRNSRPSMRITYAYDFVRYAEQQILENKLSPDVICREAKLSGWFERIVSTKIIYNYIDKRWLKVRNIDLQLKVKRKIQTNRNNRNKRIFGANIEKCFEIRAWGR